MELFGTVALVLGFVILALGIVSKSLTGGRKVDLKRQAQIRAKKKRMGNVLENYAMNEHFARRTANKPLGKGTVMQPDYYLGAPPKEAPKRRRK